jgi:hypothetical protein
MLQFVTPISFPAQDEAPKADFPIRGRTYLPITEVFRSMVTEFEATHPHGFSVMRIAKEYGIPHRRVYDFFNMLCSLGACSVIERSRLRWCGLEQIPHVLKEVYAELELSNVDESIQKTFSVGKSPTLGLLARKFICLYLYFGFDNISMRDAMRIFRDRRADVKSLERRLYLVLSFLEVIGVIMHTGKTSEYRLMIDRTAIVDQPAARKSQNTTNTFDMSLEALLNRPPPAALRERYQKRELAFAASITG